MLSLAFVVLAAKAYAQEYTFSNEATSTVYTVTQDTGADIPLASKHFEWPMLPYKADSGNAERGIQVGYNICNETTAGPESMCQTAFFNSIDDLCLFGSDKTDDEEFEPVGNIEGEMVPYCTSDKYGTRMLEEGTIQGLQFVRTPDYIQVTGQLDQTHLHLPEDDYGGELDPHGADLRGNPLGGLLYSSAFGPGNESEYKQVDWWSMFIGSGIFCFKACDPDSPRKRELCENRYDRIGCTYNAPASYQEINGTFTECESDNQLPVGQYVASNGETMTWSQPPEDEGAITSIPYDPSVPASSQCTTYSSDELYGDLRTATRGAASGSGASSSASSSAAASSSAGSAAKEEGQNAAAADTEDGDSAAVTLHAGLSIAASLVVVGAGMLFV